MDHSGNPGGPAAGAVAVVPHDANNLAAPCRALYVGVAGNVAAVMADGSVVTFVNVQSGSVLPVGVKRVNLTNTTATNIVALY